MAKLYRPTKKSRLKKQTKYSSWMIAVIVLGLVIVGYFIMSSLAASTTVDIKAYYPNPESQTKDAPNYQGYYEDGKNSNGAWAVLWFEKQDQWSYKMFNSNPSAPSARCNFDRLSWWDDNTFRYDWTHNDCLGSGHSNDIYYNAPIVFLPRYWDSSKPWTFTGQADASYRENGVEVCRGVNNYTNKILGWETDPKTNTKSIHWQTNQTTTWNWGNGASSTGCKAGVTNYYQEDNYLVDSIPLKHQAWIFTWNSYHKGVKHTTGGNLQVNYPNWDIVIDQWKPLPANTVRQ